MPLTFVHLSDIHFQKRSGDVYDLDVDLRDQLENDLSSMVENIKMPIHGIFITGDIAFSGKEEEYAKAKTWLEHLCRDILKRPETRSWVVPGNHDVDRDVIKKSKPLRDIHSRLRDKKQSGQKRDEELREILQDETYAKIILNPMQHYQCFTEQYGCGISAGKPYWEEDIPITASLKLRIRGLTSTIISDSDDNDGDNRLLLGQAQAMLKQEPGVVYMTLCHHPIDWLLDKDEVGHILNLRSRIQLFGHKHNQAIEYIDYNNANLTLRLVSGAVHPERDKPGWKPRYNIICLDGEDTPSSLRIKLYPRVWHEDSKTFKPDQLCGKEEYIEYPTKDGNVHPQQKQMKAEFPPAYRE